MTSLERWILAGIVVGGAVVRLVWAASVPLLDGETYYWVWSKTLALSYLDHPPFLAYLIRLTTILGDQQLLVRLGPMLAGVIVPLALFTLAREMFSVRAGLIAAAVYQLVPVLTGSGLFATPEMPLFLWWSLALVCVRRALWVDPRWWVPAGVAIGLGMLSKMTMIALPVGILGFVLTRRRDALQQPWPYAGAAIAVALFLPVVIWNATNDWANVRYVMHERPKQMPPGLPGLLALAIEQLPFTFVMFPVLLWMIGPAIRGRSDDRLAFMLWMILPTLILMIAVTIIGGSAHGYWAGPAYLGLVVLLGAYWPGRPAAVAMGVNAALMAYAVLLPMIPWLPAPPGVAESVSGWPEVARRAEALADALPEPVVFVVDHFEGAAQLAYHTGRRRPVTIPKPFAGSVWSAPSQYPGASAVWIYEPQWRITARPEEVYSRVVQHDPLAIVERGKEVRRFRFWTAAGLRP